MDEASQGMDGRIKPAKDGWMKRGTHMPSQAKPWMDQASQGMDG